VYGMLTGSDYNDACVERLGFAWAGSEMQHLLDTDRDNGLIQSRARSPSN